MVVIGRSIFGEGEEEVSGSGGIVGRVLIGDSERDICLVLGWSVLQRYKGNLSY